MPKIIDLCDAYDKAEKAYQNYYGGPVQPDPLEGLITARRELLDFVRKAAGLIRKKTNETPWVRTQSDLNALAYFSAWHITRGGWKVALRDD